MNEIKLVAYVVELSNGTKIQVDLDEVDKVMGAVSSSSAVMVRRGVIVNPNFIVAIVPDYERIFQIREKNRINAHAIEQGQKKPEGIVPLPDEFATLRAEIGQKMKLLK